MTNMDITRLRRGAAICGIVLGLAGCAVYQQPAPYYAGGYQPAPVPYGGYYAPAPVYAYAPPVYAGPTIGLGFSFWGGGGGHHEHHWR
jgi:hypothetical protein